MNFFGVLNSFSKRISIILSGLILLSGSVFSVGTLPVRLGPPERISPVPGPDNPDPVLENLVAVMDNHYQLPWYPGGFPDYLSQIYFLSNYYITSGFNFNPCDDRIMHITHGQNVLRDRLGVFAPFQITSNTYATSFDRGRTWSFGPPIEQIIPLGGTISQVINSSLGPGLYNTYGKDGKLIAGGWGFFDMTVNPGTTNLQAGFLFTTSDDDGKTWKNPKIELASDQDYFYFPDYLGLMPREFYLTPDPSNPNFIHASSMFLLAPNQIFWGLYYTSSNNGGKSFQPIRQIYTMIDDPVWRSKYFDPNFPDPSYFLYGGATTSSGNPIPFDDNIILLPISRNLAELVPTRTPPSDQAVVRSLDNGKTWEKVAGATELYLFPSLIFDPGFANPAAGQIVNGFLSFPFFFESGGQLASPVVSPVTGRLYLTYMAVNAPISDFNTRATIDHVLLNSSSDKGVTFSPSVQINRTPTNILPGAQQAFGASAIMTRDGYYCVAYYDFRNWTGFPGEDIANTPLPTDAWLAVYRETEDPRGGSTGVGLDFVGEIRLTPESFNARIINLATPRPYITPFITGTPEFIPLLVNNNNELFVVFSMQSEEGVSPANISIGYRGMTIDTNGYVTNYVQRFKFANVSNQ